MTIDKDSKVAVLKSDIDLRNAHADDPNNMQATSLEDLNYVKIVATAPSAGETGQLFYNTADNRLYICIDGATNDFEILAAGAAFVAD
jgi:hypothetical protein